MRPLRALFRALSSELYLSYRFIWRDLSTTLIPAGIFTIAAFKQRADPTFKELFFIVLVSLIYNWLYIYSFNIANQLEGRLEDRINKPDRPLSAGLVSVQGAQIRWIVVTSLFAMTGCYLGFLKWTFLWITCIVLYNFLGWSRSWFLKNLIVMPVGTIALLVPAWELTAPMTPLVWRWILLLSAVIGLTVNLQDLRDMEGDRQVGRRTMPIVLGELRTRKLLCFFFLVQALTVHFFLMRPAGPGFGVFLCDSFLAILNIVISIRIMRYRNKQDDHKTYMYYTYWFCLILASTIIVF